MEQIAKLSSAQKSDQGRKAAFLAAYAVMVICILVKDKPWASVNFILGSVILTYIFQERPKAQTSLRLLFPAIFFVLISIMLQRPAALLAGVSISLLCLAEHKWGRLQLTAFLVLLCMTPSLQYLIGVFSFPIRLWLTGIAGNILLHTGTPTTVAGNVITFGGLDYTVDPACMGLKMLLASLLCGLFLLVHMQRKQGKRSDAKWVFLFLSVVFALNLIANVIRMLILVYFDIRPGTMIHELTGLACLAAYVLLPAYGLAAMIVKEKGRAESHEAALNINRGTRNGWHVHFLLLLLCVISFCWFEMKKDMPASGLAQINGYAASAYSADIAQYKGPHTLMYIKKIDDFLLADHNPVVCWIGSGYQFESLTTLQVGASTVYTGTLKKGNERLYTSWWYDNGRYATISQLDWRWRVLKGENNFSVVNVTAADKGGLEEEIKKLKNNNSFTQALK